MILYHSKIIKFATIRESYNTYFMMEVGRACEERVVSHMPDGNVKCYSLFWKAV